MLEQISIFTENRKGAMEELTGVLARAGIDMRMVITNDSAEFGIVRMLVTEPDKAFALYQEAGYMCRMDLMIAVELKDEAGSLNHLLQSVAESNINIDYLYVCYLKDAALPVAMIHTGDSMEVEECLSAKGYHLL